MLSGHDDFGGENPEHIFFTLEMCSRQDSVQPETLSEGPQFDRNPLCLRAW